MYVAPPAIPPTIKKSGHIGPLGGPLTTGGGGGGGDGGVVVAIWAVFILPLSIFSM